MKNNSQSPTGRTRKAALAPGEKDLVTPTALIIDDNLANLDVLEQLLKREGVKSISVASPARLEAALTGIDSIDVVFLDFEIPGYNGMVLFEDLRVTPPMENAHFVAYTVHISELNEARRVGFDSFLGKPLNVDQFSEHLHDILAGIPVWDVGN